MATKLIPFLVTILLIAFGTSSYCEAQVIYGQPASFSTRLFYVHWEAKQNNNTTKMSQLMIPLNGFIPLRDNMELLIYATESSNTLDASGSEHSLNGIGDFRLQVNHSFFNDQLLLSSGVSLPTGKKKLDISDQYKVINFLSKNYLGFPMRKFGEGFSFNILLGGARMINQFRIGIGLLYRYNGTYEPYNNKQKYNPGDLFSITTSIDFNKKKYLIAGDAIFTTYTIDKMAGKNIFKQSPQVTLRVRTAYKTDKTLTRIETQYIIRGDNEQYNASNGELIDALHYFGNEVRISGRLNWLFTKKWRLSPAVDWKYIGADERGNESSDILGFGIALGKNIKKNIALELGFKFYNGEADGGNINLKGLEITSSLSSTF